VTDGAVLALSGVHKSFPSPDGRGELRVLNGIDLTLSSGESIAIVGPSGSGKSTLLFLMGGLDTPTRGSVFLDGRDLGGLTDRERARVRSRRIGFVFQLHHLLPQCSVWENVLVPTLAAGRVSRAWPRHPGEPEARSEVEPAERARRLLERMGLGGRLGHRPAELSGGECLRAAVARALINRPAVLLADEPTGSLDEEAAGQLAELLVSVNREEGTTLVVVTHSPALAGLMERRCRLHGGVLEE
jgi:lipoprotein-releasing system ATP-binding protein